MNGGFVDLRETLENGSPGRPDESFWPSFTDIMMVVVMIFVIASTLLILRNWELVSELRATMEAERQAAQTAREATEANIDLAQQVAQEQEQASLLRLELARLEAENERKTRLLSERDKRLLALQGQVQELSGNLQAANRRAQTLDERLAQTTAEYAQLQSSHVRQGQRLESVLAELAELEQRYRAQSATLAELRMQRSQSEQRLASLQGELDTLQAKYQKLLRPARSAAGRQVVEVRYEKVDGDYLLRFKDLGQTSYRTVQREALEQRLAELSQRYPDSLYVRVVIPSNSGLTYDEAWRFTREMLVNYDYYYR